jgi:hypothetical protein
MKKYKFWNYRCVPFFKEELIDNKSGDFPSIEEFKEKDVYTREVRSFLITYLEKCVPIVATSFKRYNPYTEEYSSILSYYTDGEIIFNNFLVEYIKHEDFAIPVAWFDLIHKRNFTIPKFQINEDLIIENDIDIFLTAQETFQDFPTIQKLIIYS